VGNYAGPRHRHTPHYNYATAPTAITDGNNHQAGGYVFGCLNCHPTTRHATGSFNSGVQDADIGGTWQTAGGGYTAGAAWTSDGRGFMYTRFGTCATRCHTKDGSTLGSATYVANWGTTNTAGCGFCHNRQGDGNPVWTTPHTRHINTYSANTNITCNACHSGTASGMTTINGAAGRNQHPNANKDVAVNAWVGGAWVTITGAQGAQTCANTYCHSNGTALSGQTPHTAVSWSGALNCDGCHGGWTTGPSYANGSPKANSHIKHTVANSIGCQLCHAQTTANGTTIFDVSKHVNKTYDMWATGTFNGATVTFSAVGSPATCSSISCHGGATATWGSVFNCTGCHESSSILGGVHNKHYNTATPATAITTGRTANGTAYIFNCGTCHSAATHYNGANDVNFNVTWTTPYTWGTFKAGTVWTTDGRAVKYTANNACYSIYCHSNGAPLGSAITYQWATWNQPLAGPNCGICHAANPATNAHQKHTASGTYSMNCVKCHSATVSSTTTIANYDLHLNNAKDVAWDTINSDGSAYGSPSCANIYCHSKGTAGSAPYTGAAAPYRAAVWTTNFGSSCDGCHGGDASLTNKMATGAHNAHINDTANAVGRNIACNECHRATVPNSASFSTIANFANHVNELVNVKFDNSLNKDGDAPTYNGSATTGVNGAVRLRERRGTPATTSTVTASAILILPVTW